MSLFKDTAFVFSRSEYDKSGCKSLKSVARYKKTALESISYNGTDLSFLHITKHTFNDVCFDNADFSGVTLKSCVFNDCSFTNVKMNCATIISSTFKNCNFMDADISASDIYGTIFETTDNTNGMNSTSFNRTIIHSCKFIRQRMTEATFRSAIIDNILFSACNMSDTCFTGAHLDNVKFDANCDLYGSSLLPLCPETGSFEAWKSLKLNDEIILIKLFIPTDAKRSSGTSHKCRCSKAMVLEMTNTSTGNNVMTLLNNNMAPTIYTVGEMVYPDSFDENRWNECSHGIHFFMAKADALHYPR